ncbi:putative receptor-like serine/threonine-protein kinase [Hibiscus syriacus]|uniref:Receptor-like serine/threonine-protein kinase n=1 Tax=Hibiscus syriacus TaxID=106335 RepID=A0A6A3D151_HIBSY|nr:probable receptor-like serine/threonine-protein kinase At5g57670 [Hibiscus syriacus]KAE8735463.1 putative receptor-like serine/threonine-protein kinase [Hibiscus syriacus]
MVTSKPAKILIGIPLGLDRNDSRELLSWAIRVIARPNDTIVALHVLVGEEQKKNKLVIKDQAKFRQARARVISVLGEFASTCQSKQVNLEAKVGVNTSVKRGLIEEAKSISADFLLLLGSRKRSKETSHKITSYCLEHAPEGCAVVSIGKSKQRQQNSTPKSTHLHFDETHQWSTTSSNKSDNSSDDASVSPVQNPIVSKTKLQKQSPRTVLDALQGESNSTEDDSSSFWDSTMSGSPQPPKFKGEPYTRKQMSPYKFISMVFKSPLRKRKANLSNKEKEQPLMRCFSFEEISNATNNFHPDNTVGRGGYSEVYRGDLSDGRAIAVKMLAKDNKEKEFLTELGIIGHVCHLNTAKLVGCCVENGLYLIFNLSEKGTLATALHGKTSVELDWPARYKIALGVARGLHYLHKCCKHRIIHRDIKASNVLLGQDYEPQITDFGLAKWLPNKWTHHAVIPIEGTFGYLAPEYFMHGIVDEKTDVFAFGVLLLEIITGRRPVDSSKKNLLLWAKPLMESGHINELADPKLKGRYDEDQMHTSVLTACYCVRQSAEWRPSMSEVLELLMSGQDSDVAKSWRMPKFTSDELDDYSMVFGYEVPTHISLEDFL